MRFILSGLGGGGGGGGGGGVRGLNPHPPLVVMLMVSRTLNIYKIACLGFHMINSQAQLN